MNRLGIAAVMLLIAGIICGCELFTVNNSTESYTKELERISELISEGNFDTAQVLSKEVFSKWEKASRHLDKYLYHDYVDRITEEMAALPVYAENKDTVNAKSQIAEIKTQLTSLKESELPYMHNIL